MLYKTTVWCDHVDYIYRNYGRPA